MTDEQMMALALAQAKMAAASGEVPVGAVLVSDRGHILARAHNQTIGLCDPTAHAEVLALRRAAETVGNYRLLGTTIYVTIEPCVMCTGALIHARVARIVYGTEDPKWGGVASLYKMAHDPRLNHHPDITGAVLAEECRRLMQEFFRARRACPPATDRHGNNP